MVARMTLAPGHCKKQVWAAILKVGRQKTEACIKEGGVQTTWAWEKNGIATESGLRARTNSAGTLHRDTVARLQIREGSTLLSSSAELVTPDSGTVS